MPGSEAGNISARAKSYPEASSPAFLSPRLWNEDDIFLPPSSEVPHRPVLESRREQTDRGCFGLYVFVMVLFAVQGISAVLSANYQLPHEFQLCNNRLRQESVQVARVIPQAEINQHNLESEASSQISKHSKLVDIHGNHIATILPSHHLIHPSPGTGDRAHVPAAVAHVVKSGGRRLLGTEAAVAEERALGSMLVKTGLQSIVSKLSKDQQLQEGGEGEEDATTPADGNGNSTKNAVVAAEAPASAVQGASSDSSSSEEEDAASSELGRADEAMLDLAMRRMRSASGIVAFLAVSSIVFGLVWVLLLAHFTEPLVYLTLAALPFAFLSAAVVSLLTSEVPIWAMAVMLVLSVASVGVFLWVKGSLSLTISLLKCASNALLENYSLFLITVFLSVVQVLWLGCCLLFIVLEFMSGVAVRVYSPAAQPGGPQEAHCEWQTDGWAYVGMGFILVIMLWTNSIIEELKRFSAAGAISLWYSSHPQGSFKLKDGAPNYPALSALHWAMSSSFGSICFSALVSNVCETLKWAFKPRNLPPGVRKPETHSGFCESVWYVLEDVIGFVNRFSVPMMAHSGYPFCHSCKVTSLLMHRNNLAAIVDDSAPSLILRIGALVVALWAAMAGWLLSNAYVEWAVMDSGQLRVVHGIVARFVLMASFVISLLVLNFFASLLLDAMDVLFLLYAMDRDNRTMEPRGAILHELLAAQQVGKAQPGLSNYTPRGWNFRQSLSSRRPRSTHSSAEAPLPPAVVREESEGSVSVEG